MWKTVRFFLLLAAVVCFGVSQTAVAEWLNFSNPAIPNGFAFDGTNVWIPALGGLVKLNASTDEFTVYTSSSGLPCSCGNAAAVAPDGVAWVAMTKGIGAVHPDGTIERYIMENSELESDYGRAIAVSPAGVVWAGTDEGVYSYDGTVWEKHPAIGTPLLAKTNVISISTDGTVWIGTEGGVRMYDGAFWVIYDDSNSDLVPGQGLNIRDISFGPDGKVWFATYGGLLSFDGTDWETHTPTMLPLYEAVAVDDAGRVYAGQTEGLSYYDGTDWTLLTTDNSGLPSKTINAIDVAPDGTVWVSTAAGTVSLKDETWTPRSHSNYPELQGQVQDMAEDSSGVIWMAAVGAGVVVLDGASLTSYTTADGLLGNMVSTVEVAPDDTVWFGLWDGVSHFDGTDFVNYSSGLGNFPGSSVVDLAFAEDGTLWAAAQDMSGISKLCYFDGTSWNERPLPLLASFSSLDVSEDGVVWIGTNIGVATWNGQRVDVFDTSHGLPNSQVTCVVKGQGANMWIGTEGGVALTDGTTWKTYNTGNTMLMSNSIKAIYPTADGPVYVATDNGIAVIAEDTSVRYSSQFGGLLVDIMTSILQASDGRIVASGIVGLSVLTSPSFPVLSDGAVTPGSGMPGTTFTYSVNYSNPDALLAPDITVSIDSSDGYEMALVTGQANDGVYEFQRTLTRTGPHNYHFVATDENGARTRQPYDFSYSGPFISDKPMEVIITVDKVFYMPDDEMHVFLTVANRSQEVLDFVLFTAVELPTGNRVFFRYPSEFGEEAIGIPVTLGPGDEVEDFPLLSIVLQDGMIPFGQYKWLAACADPNAAGLVLLSDISQANWSFQESITPQH